MYKQRKVVLQMSACSGNCSSCSSAEGCKDKDPHLKQNEYSDIKKTFNECMTNILKQKKKTD